MVPFRLVRWLLNKMNNSITILNKELNLATSNVFPLRKLKTRNNVLSRKNLHSAVIRGQKMPVQALPASESMILEVRDGRTGYCCWNSLDVRDGSPGSGAIKSVSVWHHSPGHLHHSHFPQLKQFAPEPTMHGKWIL